MTPDVSTLLLTITLLDAFLAGVMFVYGRHRKVYPGFGLWTAGVFSFALGFGSVLSRLVVPLQVSRVLSTLFLTLAVVLRLDGTVSFIRQKTIARAWYAMPVLLALAVLILVRLGRGMQETNVVLSAFVAIGLATGSWVFLTAPAPGRLLPRAAGTIECIAAMAVLWRAVSWLLYPETGLLQATAFQGYFFCFAILMEVGLASIFLLLCSQRLEMELTASRQELKTALEDLKSSVARLKVLRGLLSICSYCKKIQVVGEQWQQFEVYVRNHSEADFTHGICPECIPRQFPEVADQILGPRPSP